MANVNLNETVGVGSHGGFALGLGQRSEARNPKLESEGLAAWGIGGAGRGARAHAILGVNRNSDETGNGLNAESIT